LSLPLGYVFWHRPHPGTSRSEYEESLMGFQRSLKAHPPGGFVEAFSFREDALPWSRRCEGAYEDWYLVRDFQALGDLDEAAVDTSNKAAHDFAARGASVIAGGLYRLISGDLRPGKARMAAWIQKPTRMPYRAFFETLSESMGDRESRLWQRQMVLGPAPEFCLQSDDAVPLPRGIRGRVLRIRLVAEGEP
jgi:hypothetical protein